MIKSASPENRGEAIFPITWAISVMSFMTVLIFRSGLGHVNQSFGRWLQLRGQSLKLCLHSQARPFVSVMKKCCFLPLESLINRFSFPVASEPVSCSEALFRSILWWGDAKGYLSERVLAYFVLAKSLEWRPKDDRWVLWKGRGSKGFY